MGLLSFLVYASVLVCLVLSCEISALPESSESYVHIVSQYYPQEHKMGFFVTVVGMTQSSSDTLSFSYNSNYISIEDDANCSLVNSKVVANLSTATASSPYTSNVNCSITLKREDVYYASSEVRVHVPNSSDVVFTTIDIVFRPFAQITFNSEPKFTPYISNSDPNVYSNTPGIWSVSLTLSQSSFPGLTVMIKTPIILLPGESCIFRSDSSEFLAPALNFTDQSNEYPLYAIPLGFSHGVSYSFECPCMLNGEDEAGFIVLYADRGVPFSVTSNKLEFDNGVVYTTEKLEVSVVETDPACSGPASICSFTLAFTSPVLLPADTGIVLQSDRQWVGAMAACSSSINISVEPFVSSGITVILVLSDKLDAGTPINIVCTFISTRHYFPILLPLYIQATATQKYPLAAALGTLTHSMVPYPVEVVNITSTVYRTSAGANHAYVYDGKWVIKKTLSFLADKFDANVGNFAVHNAVWGRLVTDDYLTTTVLAYLPNPTFEASYANSTSARVAYDDLLTPLFAASTSLYGNLTRALISGTNGVQDYEETDVDCGGHTSNRCSGDKRCTADSDCIVNRCDNTDDLGVKIRKTGKCHSSSAPYLSSSLFMVVVVFIFAFAQF